MPLENASVIVAVRNALDSLIVRSTSQPESVSNPPPAEAELMNILRDLSKPTAAGSDVNPEDALMRYSSNKCSATLYNANILQKHFFLKLWHRHRIFQTLVKEMGAVVEFTIM